MAVDKTAIQVTAEWLRNKLDTNPDPKDFLLLDTTWAPPSVDDKQLYVSCHIPGAVFVDLNTGVTPTRLLPRNIPDCGKLQEYLRSLGVHQTTHIVTYNRDNLKELRSLSAYRFRWILKAYGFDTISVLDGGLVNWKQKGYPVSSGYTENQVKGDVVLQPLSDNCTNEQHGLKTYSEMTKIVEGDQFQIVDSRYSEFFNGTEPEPSPGTKKALSEFGLKELDPNEIISGHMSGARNIPFLELFDECTTCFKDENLLLKVFSDAGVDLQKPVITTCFTGRTACGMSTAAELLGCNNVSVYYGSWTEWGQMAKFEQQL